MIARRFVAADRSPVLTFDKQAARLSLVEGVSRPSR